MKVIEIEECSHCPYKKHGSKTVDRCKLSNKIIYIGKDCGIDSECPLDDVDDYLESKFNPDKE